MNKILVLLSLLLGVSTFVSAQSYSRNKSKVDSAYAMLALQIKDYTDCVVSTDLNTCTQNLLKEAKDPYQKFIVAGVFYKTDSIRSYELHKAAYEANPYDLSFIAEYALELHRRREYALALEQYLKMINTEYDNYKLHVELADCYLNVGDIEKSVEHWRLSDHPAHHTSIDKTIYDIYGRTDQLQRRDYYRKEIQKGNHKLFYQLIFLDSNWELDWWNTLSQEQMLAKDLEWLKHEMGTSSVTYKTVHTYLEFKKLKAADPIDKDAVLKVLKDSKLILNDSPLPAYSQMASEILSLCFSLELVDMQNFYDSRGKELMELAEKNKDSEWLNIYAHLQVELTGKVDPAIDKRGWVEYKDPRFATSYFIGKGENNRYDDPELKQALIDFPNSARVYWIKTNCAFVENINKKAELIELMKREFRSLETDPARYSYRLKAYYAGLQSLE